MITYAQTHTYTPKKWDLSGLQGISDRTLEVHFGLYEGYVKNVNLLNERLASLRSSGQAKGADPSYAELVRRLGFEYDGMRLHEYYFENMTPQPKPVGSGKLHEALGTAFGGFDQWKSDFAAVAGMRGVGWAIAYYDDVAQRISNHWIGDHEIGHPAGFTPIVVLDVWEHAFMLDYKPSEKAKYVEAFLANVDWATCESRLP